VSGRGHLEAGHRYAAIAAAFATAIAAQAAQAQSAPTIGELRRDEPELAASFYTPGRGPLPLDEARAQSAGVEGDTDKGAVYVPECASPGAPPDHIAHLQSLGLAVVVPSLGGDRCVVATDHLGSVHQELVSAADELAALGWAGEDELYLVGHGVGADVASTFTRDDVFKGIIGFAAACPFGVQNTTPMITFRALDDPVLRNRGSRCSDYATSNAMHVEFSGRDHFLRLGPNERDEAGARELIRRSLNGFMGLEGGVPAATIRERDRLDLRQLGEGG